MILANAIPNQVVNLVSVSDLDLLVTRVKELDVDCQGEKDWFTGATLRAREVDGFSRALHARVLGLGGMERCSLIGHSEDQHRYQYLEVEMADGLTTLIAPQLTGGHPRFGDDIDGDAIAIAATPTLAHGFGTRPRRWRWRWALGLGVEDILKWTPCVLSKY